MPSKSLYTLGYGGLGTKAAFEFFLTVLRTLNINWLIDVRRDATKAFRHQWTKAYLTSQLDYYFWLPQLGNQQRALPWARHPRADKALAFIIEETLLNHRRPVLLCAERPGLTYEGNIRCHRIEVAQELLTRLGNDWGAYDLWISPPTSFKTVPIPRTVP